MRIGDVEYFDFTPDRLGRWQDADAWTLAAARFRVPGEPQSVTVLICGYPEQWVASEDKQAAQAALIDRAQCTLGGILSHWRPEMDDQTNLTAAFLVYGFRVAPPRGHWGEEKATHRRGVLPTPAPA